MATGTSEYTLTTHTVIIIISVVQHSGMSIVEATHGTTTEVTLGITDVLTVM